MNKKGQQKNNEMKPVLVHCLAWAHCNAESCYIFLKSVKAGEHIEGYNSPPKLKEWLELYKSHRKFNKYLRDTFSKFGKLPRIAILISESIDFSRNERIRLGKTNYHNLIKLYLEQMKPERFEKIKRISEKFLQKIFKLSLKELESDTKKEFDEALEKEFRTKLLKQPEILFFYRIWIPCWLLYGQFPPTLLRSARTGDLDSIEKILRLDSSTIHDPKIAEIYHQANSKKNKSVYNLMYKSLNKSPRVKITLQKIKINLAGLISTISIYLCQRLTEPEIRALFDAIAYDSGKSYIDTDLPDSPESFSKAIQRERKAWSIFDKPGQKILKFLSEYKSSCSVNSSRHEEIKYKKLT